MFIPLSTRAVFKIVYEIVDMSACWCSKLLSIARLKRDDTRTETRFGLSAKRTSPFKLAGGCQFSRPLAAEVCGSADSDCIDRVLTYSARLLATHSIRNFPLHFPSRASPRAIGF